MRYVEMPGGSVNGTGMPTSWTGSGPLITPEPWTQDALCAETDPELFFPEKGGDRGAAAKAICARCDVLSDCLMFALRTREPDGVYGGMTPKERARLIKVAAA